MPDVEPTFNREGWRPGSLHLRPLEVMWWFDEGHRGAWFRLFGWGLSFDRHIRPPLFTERVGLRKGLHVSLPPHDEPWCLMVLKPPKGDSEV